MRRFLGYFLLIYPWVFTLLVWLNALALWVDHWWLMHVRHYAFVIYQGTAFEWYVLSPGIAAAVVSLMLAGFLCWIIRNEY